MNSSTQQQQQQQHHEQHQDDSHSKKRTRVTPSQLSILEDTFSVSSTPDSKMRKHLAQKLQMPERSIQIWFQNRRAKVKMLQRRALLREEQEMTRAKLYAEAAAAAAASRHYSHSSIGGGPMLTPASSSSNASFWYGASPITPYPQYPTTTTTTTKLPIQRSWSLDPTVLPPPPPPPLHHHHLQHPPNMSSFYATSLTDEAKEPFYHGNISPSPTPVPLGDLDTEAFKSFSDSAYIDNTPTESSDSATTGYINVNAVTIGTWHRMKMSRQDLLCCFQLSERTFEWHIRDSNYHFKMIISFDLVASLDITILDNGIFAQMDLKLNEPPLFFMENMDDMTWIQCSDFTEGMQATCILHHTLRGLASDLRQELLGMISLDQHLCQVIRFPMVSPITDLSLGTATTTMAVHTSATDSITTLDPSTLMSWRHQSLPLHMNDGDWSQSHTTF